MKIRFLVCFVFVTIASCESHKRESVRDRIKTGTPLERYVGRDSVEQKSILKIKDYLINNESEAKVTDFFIDTVERKIDTIVFYVHHYNYYVMLDKTNKSVASIKEAKQQGLEIDSVFVPPTGNWSGMDRAMLYLIKKDSLIDILYQ